MPIYEFYCSPCHTIFSFLSRKMQVPLDVTCPKCGKKKLEKKVSRFAISKGLIEKGLIGDAADPFSNVDEAKLEQLMSEFAPSMQDSGEDDPRQMAQLMKRMFEISGSEPTGAMLEAVKRMEAGEDPDAIDEQIGSEIDAQNDPFAASELGSRGGGGKKWRRLLEAPNIDPELYELQ
jgi:putative FmdB family regulatory protein